MTDDEYTDPNHPLSLANRSNNPGAIKFGPDAARYGATGRDKHGYATFADPETGTKAMSDLLRRHYKGRTIPQMSRRYSPSRHADWARNVMRISGFASHEVPDLDDPEQFARLQAAIMREQGYKKMPLPGARPPGLEPSPPEVAQAPQDAQPLPQPQESQGPQLSQPQDQPAPAGPQPLPEQPPLPVHGAQPDWYKRMVEHQERWGYDPTSQQNLPEIAEHVMDIADVLSPIGKLPLGVRAGRGILDLLRRQSTPPAFEASPTKEEIPIDEKFLAESRAQRQFGNIKEKMGDPMTRQYQVQDIRGKGGVKRERDPGKDYDISEIRKRMEAIARGEPPSPRMQQVLDKGAPQPQIRPRGGPYSLTGHDYTNAEIEAAMRQIMRERGMEP